MRVAIVGTGYVGLVSGVCLAAKGHHVTCVDTNPEIVEKINAGIPHIHERGLPELLREVIDRGNFKANADLATALATADIAMIAVGTPSENGVIDLTYVRAVARSIGKYLATMDRYLTIVVKSTVVPGTTDTVVREELERGSGKKHPAFGLGMNPEFLREGEAIEDFMFPDRVVLGHEDPRSLAHLEELYAPWTADKVAVNTRTAELIKYANNALLATQISAINEIANLAAAVGGIDIMDVAKGVHLDKRWNPIVGERRANPGILTYLVPGCGFGGSCFPKDVQALRSQGKSLGLPMSVLSAVLDVNDIQPNQVVDTLRREVGSLAGRRCLVLGLAFKPDTDDVRESASLKIVSGLLSENAKVTIHDPIATPGFLRALGADAARAIVTDDWRRALGEADIVVIATRWEEYRGLAECDVNGKVVFDARRIFPKASVLAGARYLSVGRRL